MPSTELNILLACSWGIPHKNPQQEELLISSLLQVGKLKFRLASRSPSQEVMGQTFNLPAQSAQDFLIQCLVTTHSLYKHFPALS